MFINESLSSFFFGGIKRVNFGNLGHERVLEFNGKTSHLWQNIRKRTIGTTCGLCQGQDTGHGREHGSTVMLARPWKGGSN